MKKKHLQLLVGVSISVFFLWYAFRSVNIAQLWSAIRQTNLWLAGLMMTLTMASFYWRTFRWQIFLDPVKHVPSWRLYPPLMVGFAFNNVFPARAGEFARPLALAKSEGIPFSAGFSTVVLERLVDVLTLLVLLITMPLYITLDPAMSFAVPGFDNLSISAAWLERVMPKLSIMAVILMCGILSFLIPSVKRLYIRILHALPVIPPRFKAKLEEFIETFAKGFASLKSAKAIALTLLHSVVIWCSVAFSFQLMSWGFPDVTLTFGEALAFLVFTCVVITLPSSPGFWGLYEFGGMVALVVMGVVPNTPEGQGSALAFTMVVHFLQWLPMTAYGLWAAGRLHVSAGEVADKDEVGRVKAEG